MLALRYIVAIPGFLIATMMLPPSSLTALRNALAETGVMVREGLATDQKLCELRQMYEPYVEVLSRYLLISLPPWFRVNATPDSWQSSNWQAAISAVATENGAPKSKGLATESITANTL